jgi:hypothetical protein
MLAALVGKFRLRVSVELTFENFSILIDDIPPKGPQVFNGNGFYYISVDSTDKNKDRRLSLGAGRLAPSSSKRHLAEARTPSLQRHLVLQPRRRTLRTAV